MAILTNLKKVQVGYDKEHSVEVAGIEKIVWGESDPWIPQEYPGALRVTDFQHIKPILMQGSLTCFDVDSIETAFYKTDIQRAEGTQTAINEWGERQRIEYFHVWLRDHQGDLREYELEGVRLRQVEWPEFTKTEAKPSGFIIHFYAEKIQEVSR